MSVLVVLFLETESIVLHSGDGERERDTGNYPSYLFLVFGFWLQILIGFLADRLVSTVHTMR